MSPSGLFYVRPIMFSKDLHGSKIIKILTAILRATPRIYAKTVMPGAQSEQELEKLIADINNVTSNSEPTISVINTAIGHMNKYAMDYGVEAMQADEFKLIYFTCKALTDQFDVAISRPTIILTQSIMVWMLDDCLASAQAKVSGRNVNEECGRSELKDRLIYNIKNLQLEKHFGDYGVLVTYKTLHNMIKSEATRSSGAHLIN